MPKAAHLAHVLLAADSMDHRARREKQQPFEKRMSHQVKDPGRIRGHATSHEHVAELRNSGVGKNFLDVSLANANRGGKQSR